MTFIKTSLLIALLMLMASCKDLETRTETLDRIDEQLKQEHQQSQANDELPAEVADALIPSIQLNVPDVPLVEDEQTFDISVNSVPAEQFFLSLVEGTSYNMIIHPEVRGSISLNLKGVSIPEVMEAVRDVYGFEFVRTSYGFQVLPSRLQARIYQINHLNIDRSGSSSTFVSSGALTQGPSASATGDSGETTIDGASDGRSNVVGTQIRTVQPSTSFWQELQTSILAIVGSGEGRSVVVNPESGVVVVRAIPNELREVEAFLQATQLIVQRQVIIEAKIIEVELKEGFQSGINWAQLAGSITASNIGGGSVLVNETGVSDIAGFQGVLNPNTPGPITGIATPSPIESTLTSAFGGVFTLAINGHDFSAFIELLKTQGNVQVLSSPRVSTMNNQKALIKVGTDEFFVTGISNTTVTGTTTTTTPTVELTPFFSGIALDVTPQISGHDAVTLHIHPSVSNVIDQQKSISLSGQTQQLPLALSTVRESDSIVRAKSGQVVVIGGLMQDSINDVDAGAPVLGDLPVLGNLFKHRKKASVKSELVILLKPIVVGNDDEWTDALETTQQGINRLRNTLDGWQRRGGTNASEGR